MTPDLPPPPAELARFSAHLTPAELLALINALGGTRVYFAATPDAEGELARAIGLDAARRLGQALAGSLLTIPLARHWRIRILREVEGLTYRQIAQRLGMTENAVWRHLDAARLTHLQRDLFQ
jgi:DNA-directed RNA polymerase specialized sigma24 family protein